MFKKFIAIGTALIFTGGLSLVGAALPAAADAPTSGDTVGLYVYKMITPANGPSFGNSGPQTLELTQSGTSYFDKSTTSFDLPAGVCGSDWAVQEDKISWTGGTFVWPPTFQQSQGHIVDVQTGTGTATLVTSEHSLLSAWSKITIPACSPPDLCPNIDGVQATVPDGMVVTDGNCVTAPCVDTATYSYTYDGSQHLGGTAPNGGVITVTGNMCKTLYITSTSWTFDGNTASPQHLSAANYLKIHHTGSGTQDYSYGAPVTCGQGDIYAAWGDGSVDAYIVPTSTLIPPQGWEKFLHDVIRQNGNTVTSGPTPTYLVQTDNGGLGGVSTCVITIVPGPPTFTDVCGTANDTYLPLPDVTGEHFSYSVNDQRSGGVGTVTITAVADAGYKFADSIDASSLTWSHNFTNEACPNIVIPDAPQPPTFTDLCGTANDGYTLPTLGASDHYTFQVSDTTTAGVRTVVITAVANAGYEFSNTLTADQLQWSKTFTDVSCVITTTDPSGSTCDVDQTGLDSWIYVDLNANVVYTIDGVNGGNAITNYYTSVPAGTYTVHADAASGFTLTPKSGVAEPGDTDTHHSWVITVLDKTLSPECQLITHDAAEVDATSTDLTCVAGNITSGTISVIFPLGQEGDVTYTVDGVAVPFDGTHDTATVTVKSGAHTVIATPVGSDGITLPFGNTTGVQDQGTGVITFDLTVGVSTDDSCDLKTLALTGRDFNALGTSLIGGGIFFLGLGFMLVFRRRNSESAVN